MTYPTSNLTPEDKHSPIKTTHGARIYVACLAAYNNGILHGTWVQVTQPGNIMEEVCAMLAASPIPHAEEWAIHDYDGFEGAHLCEYASFETVCRLAEFLALHGELGAQLHSHFGGDLNDARAAMEDYVGCFLSPAHFAEDLNTQTDAEIPAWLKSYIDWEAFARDMELNGEIFTLETRFDEVHIFWSR